MEKVSVIIPTYNRDYVLKRAVDSVLIQDYENFELLVIDDGSTDDTFALCESYGNSIKYIYQENRGVSAARNLGIKESDGEFIAFLDSDDSWMEGKLSAQVQFFRDNPDSVICQTEEIWIRHGKRVNPMKKHRKLSGDIFMESLNLCLISPSAVMMKRSLLDEVGLFDEDLLSCEDYDLWLRILLKYPADLIDVPYISKYGGHEDQLSRVPGLDKYRIESLAKLLERKDLDEDKQIACVKVLREKCRIYAGGCMKRGKSDLALKYVELAEKFS